MKRNWQWLLLYTLAASACSTENSAGDGGANVVTPGGSVVGEDGSIMGADGKVCQPNRDFLATNAWPQVLAPSCLSCHGPGGIAEEQRADFVLKPTAYPGFLEENLSNFSTVAATQNGGMSIVLRKALGELNHGGGAVLQADSDEYAALEALVQRSQSADACPDPAESASFHDVTLLNPVATFRKITLQLAGRLPNGPEFEQLAEAGEDALPTLVSNLMKEDAFYDRLVEIFNDQWLTDRYMGNSQNVLDDNDFPVLDGYYEELDDESREEARASIAREPLHLMAYIVREELPFTEILTADYTALNPFTARIYNNTDLVFDDAYDADEFRAGKIYVMRDGQKLEFPHAGILSSPMFLNRYPTSRTNRNRHRASVLLRELLATDILRIADRPIDPTQAVNFANPTREDPQCRTCHVILDPIAGAFQKWDDNDQEEYEPDRVWYEEMFLPGFGEEQMQRNDYADALQWLGQRIASDGRFPLSVVRNMYRGLIGEETTPFPDGDGNYLAWKTQDSTIRAIAEAFVADDYNLKTVVRELVLSPYFRGENTSAEDATRLSQLQSVGTGRLLTPELLDRKLQATVGIPWMQNGRRVLEGDYRLLFGGIDSDSVTQRLTTPNGLMSAIVWRMSNEVACKAVAYDFHKSPELRWLFPKVEQDTLPENDIAAPILEAETAIKSNIIHLYSQLLGEALQTDSEEMNRIYDLFTQTWREGRSKLVREEVSRNLTGDCQFRRHPVTNEEVAEELRITRDDNYTIRAWMAVVTYLLSDYRYIYE